MRRRDLLKAAAATPALGLPGAWWRPAAAAIPNDGTAIDIPSRQDQDRLAQALLPANRVLSYYGYPGNEYMGILGEHDPDTLLGLLRDQAAVYESVDNSRPWKLAFEVIASVAQRDPQEDGTYLLYIPTDTLQEYVDYTAANDLLLILDTQYGRNSTEQQVTALAKWLEYPHVHLALDPEFSVDEGEVPGEVLGSIDSSDLNWAQQWMADFAAEHNLPPKLLIVHQFNWYTLENREVIHPVDGVDFVLEVDGWGPPDDKRETYQVLAGDGSLGHYGFKLWYQQDEPLMTEAEVMALSPVPDVVIYQ